MDKVHGMAMARRRRTTEDSRKGSLVVREALEHVRLDDRSLKQVAGYMKKESGEPVGHCRHGVKYDRHGRPTCTAKAGNISGRTGIRDRPEEADGRRFGNRKTDAITGRNGKGAIPILTERSADFILMEKPRHGREAAHATKTAIRLSLPYKETG